MLAALVIVGNTGVELLEHFSTLKTSIEQLFWIIWFTTTTLLHSPSCPHQLCLEKHCVNSTQAAFACMHILLLGFTTHGGSILWWEWIKEEGWGKQRVLMPSHRKCARPMQRWSHHGGNSYLQETIVHSKVPKTFISVLALGRSCSQFTSPQLRSLAIKGDISK